MRTPVEAECALRVIQALCCSMLRLFHPFLGGCLIRALYLVGAHGTHRMEFVVVVMTVAVTVILHTDQQIPSGIKIERILRVLGFFVSGLVQRLLFRARHMSG
jgi:hypothetical protein